MASSKVWLRREQLRSLIASALDEIGYEDGIVSVAVSPNLDEVYATTLPWWDDEVLNEKISEGWSLESADTAEELIERADLYFDLR